MEIQELKKKSDEELRDLQNQMQEQIRQLRFEVANLQLKDVRQLRETRRDIARIKTLLSERKMQSTAASTTN